MKKINVNPRKFKDEEIDLIARYIRLGKVIVYPTDTIYGIGCDATNKKSIEKLRKIKKRDKEKPLLVLVKSFCQLRKYFYVSLKQNKYLHDLWFSPKPVSVILRQRKFFAPNLALNKEGVAVRLPKNDFLIKILKRARVPIVSTSLNFSGKKLLLNVSNIEKYFKTNKPDLIINIGEDLKKKPSRLINLIDMENIKILRK